MKLTIKTILYLLLFFFTILIIISMMIARDRLIGVQTEIFGLVDNHLGRSLLVSEITRQKELIDSEIQKLGLLLLPEEKREQKVTIDRRFDDVFQKISELAVREDEPGKALLSTLKVDVEEFRDQVSSLYLKVYYPDNQLRNTEKPVVDEASVSAIYSQVRAGSKKVTISLAAFVEFRKSTVDAAVAKARETIRINENVIYIFGVVFFMFLIMVILTVLWFVYSQVGGEPTEIKQITRRMTDGDLSMEFPHVTKGIFGSIKRLNQTMREVAASAQNIANGDFTVKIEPRSASDQLGNSLSRMAETLTELQKVTEEVALGNFSRKLLVKGSNDLVSKSINQMSETLGKNEQHNREQNWLKDGLNSLSMALSGDQTIDKLAENAISHIGRYIEAGMGVIYLYHQESENLKLVSSFAFTERNTPVNQFTTGDGIVGQVALERKPILLRTVAADSSAISSGTLHALPVNTYTYPILYENELLGVIEVATLHPVTVVQQAYLDQTNDVVASSLYSAIQRTRIQDLLSNARIAQRNAEEKTLEVQEANARLEEQSQQIRMQSEQLQQSNSQLEEQQQQLQQQAEELQQSNAMLEEQQQQLIQQTEELRHGNEQLRQAKLELDAKATDLEQSNKYKSDFLANMSHELRTPLNSIILLSKMMQKNERANFSEEDIKRARVINSAGEELLRLINDILDISKIEAGKTSLLISDFTVDELLSELKHYFQGTAKSKGLELHISDQYKGQITSDRDKVSQVLRNFISNALKFTKQGEVALVVEPSGRADLPVKFTVKDTGIGIAPEKHRKIFEAFQQVDSSISREFGGTGLGLTISQKLAMLLQGEISMSSEVGVGSEFSLYLPLVLNPQNVEHVEYIKTKVRGKSTEVLQEHAAVKVAVPLTDDRKTIQPSDKVILIVEDDNTFADIVAMVIRNMKMKVLHASTAEQGLSLVQQYQVNGIVLDLVLPDMNGVDFMRRLKSYKELRHIPVQIISGHEKNPELMRMGALDFLQKPVDQDQIQSAIQGILNFSQKNPKDLLIVEDDKGHRNALIELIQGSDIRIKGVESEDEAIQELNKGIYDAVIIDLGLAFGNGINICKYVKENHIKAPIIVYTGKQLTAEEEKNLKRYAERIIIKTVHSENRLLDELMLFLHQTRHEPIPIETNDINLNIKVKRLSGKTIMVVDDDIKNVFVLSTALEEHGAKVIDAQNGVEALNLLEETLPDLVLMDIMMPQMDGYTAIGKIRENNRLKKLPVIALTAKALKEDREKCIAAGADDYLSKPVDYEMLIGLVEAWCQKKG